MMEGFTLVRSSEFRQFALYKGDVNYHIDSRIVFNLLPDNLNVINEYKGDYSIRDDFDKSMVKKS